MLRHTCGYVLADQGAESRLIQNYLGHQNIQHTVRYKATAPAWFEKLWRLQQNFYVVLRFKKGFRNLMALFGNSFLGLATNCVGIHSMSTLQ